MGWRRNTLVYILRRRFHGWREQCGLAVAKGRCKKGNEDYARSNMSADSKWAVELSFLRERETIGLQRIEGA